MSEEKVDIPGTEDTEAPAEVSAEMRAKPDIGRELQELGRQLTEATKAVLESPEAQEVGVQLRRGLESLEKTMNQLASQTRESKIGQKVESGVGDAAANVNDRGMLDTLAETVATALQTVNQTLGQAVGKAQTRAEEVKAGQSAPQQIEIVGVEEEE